MQNMEVYEIPARNLPTLNDKIGKINSRAAKKGTGLVSIERIGSRLETDVHGRPYIIYVVAIAGDPIEFDGHTFIARIDHNTDQSGNSNLVYVMPGQQMPDQYKLASADCVHCGYNRRRRTTFIILENDTGKYSQVGSTCLKDFFGGLDPHACAKQAEYLKDVFDTAKGLTGIPTTLYNTRTIEAVEYLAYVNLAIRTYGWTSRGQARWDSSKKATADTALDLMYHYGFNIHNLPPVPIKDDFDFAEKAIAYALTVDPTANDYYFNINQIAKTQFINHQAIGLAASIINLYNRHLEEQAKANAPKPVTPASTSKHVGNVGDRLELRVTVTKNDQKEGDFGSYNLIKMVTTDGDELTAFSTGAFDPGINQEYTVRVTIKKHDEFRGVKQTIVNRVSLVS